ncbi:hypothetical protein E1B28_003702 [Marasmius oreades]|uniref:Uncharacterized protein n=1 Tax=Marasmius oreades TaxID=181124 RepID=A0A9P8AB59_9AGAR|nr:uncharacterized protein E1B28_003702 [Marasmius oreades]KAG7096254.1 hypothetical protein E1B28_003702 [Marasmius oreades]
MEFEAIDGFPGVVGRRRDFKPGDEKESSLVVSFTEYRGEEQPCNSLGTPGDIYVDKIGFTLYACYDFAGFKERWYPWCTTKFDGASILEHPEHRDSILWVHGEASWWRRRRLENRFRNTRILKTPKDFVRDLVQKSKPKRKPVKDLIDTDNDSVSYSGSRTAPVTAPPAIGRRFNRSSVQLPTSAIASNPIPKPCSKLSPPPTQLAVPPSQPIEPLVGLDWIFGGENADSSRRLHEENEALQRKLREMEEENVRLRSVNAAPSQPTIRTNESGSMAFPSPPPSAHPGISHSRSISVAYSPAPCAESPTLRIRTASQKRKRSPSPPITAPTPRPVPRLPSPSTELPRSPTPPPFPPPECPASPMALALGPPLDRIFTPSPPPCPPSPKAYRTPFEIEKTTVPSPTPPPTTPCPPSPIIENSCAASPTPTPAPAPALKKRRITRSSGAEVAKAAPMPAVVAACGDPNSAGEPALPVESVSSARASRLLTSAPASLSTVKSKGKQQEREKVAKAPLPPARPPTGSTSAHQYQRKPTLYPKSKPSNSASTSTSQPVEVKVKEEHAPTQPLLLQSSAPGSGTVDKVIDLTMDSDCEESTTKVDAKRSKLGRKPKAVEVVIIEDTDDEIQEIKPDANANLSASANPKEKAEPIGNISRHVSVHDHPEPEEEPGMDMAVDDSAGGGVEVKKELSETERFPLSHYPPENVRPLLVKLMFTEFKGRIRCIICLAKKEVNKRDWLGRCVLAKLHHYEQEHADRYNALANETEEMLKNRLMRLAQRLRVAA